METLDNAINFFNVAEYGPIRFDAPYDFTTTGILFKGGVRTLI